MAMSLGFPRWAKVRRLALRLTHAAGGALGGAATGLVAGAAGALLGLSHQRTWVLLGAALLALASSQVHSLGLDRQVQRHRGRRSGSPARTFFAWGVSLGSGVSTVITHSFFLVFLAAALTAGPLAGTVSGAVFGGVRAAIGAFVLQPRTTPSDTIDLLPRFRSLARRLNLASALLAALAIGMFLR
jgi:thiol:disulfide interchange protein